MSYNVTFYQKIVIDYESNNRESLLKFETVIPIPPVVGMIFRNEGFAHKVDRIDVDNNNVNLYCFQEIHFLHKENLIRSGWKRLI